MDLLNTTFETSDNVTLNTQITVIQKISYAFFLLSDKLLIILKYSISFC